MKTFDDIWGGSSAGGGEIAQYRRMNSSGNFTALFDGVLEVLVKGGEPSGSVAIAGNWCTGPSAAGIAMKRINVAAGDTFTFTAGAAGTAVTRSTTGTTPGVDGGASTLTGPYGTNITANGGKTGSVGALPLVAPVGGTATGGDMNAQGGRGGNIAAGVTSVSCTGGGAPNLLFDPSPNACAGGDIEAGGGGSTGGGSCGGKGGTIKAGHTSCATGGGGYGGPGVDTTAGNQSTLGGGNAAGLSGSKNGLEAPASLPIAVVSYWGLDHFGGGGAGLYSGTGGAGASGAGNGGSGFVPAGPAPGQFGAPGGMIHNSAAITLSAGNNCPGGSVNSLGTGSNVTSGAGFPGLAIFKLRRT